jgi:hypothetical protein
VANIPSNYDIAVAAYKERCSKDSILFQQPIEECSEQINSVVYLRTSPVGYVARFDMSRHRLLA